MAFHWIRSDSRSLKAAPVDSSYKTSYQSAIVTIARSVLYRFRVSWRWTSMCRRWYENRCSLKPELRKTSNTFSGSQLSDHCRNSMTNCFPTSYGQKRFSIRRPFAILNLKNFHSWSSDCHRVPNLLLCTNISSKSDDFSSRHGDLTVFKVPGPPSWIFEIWSIYVTWSLSPCHSASPCGWHTKMIWLFVVLITLVTNSIESHFWDQHNIQYYHHAVYIVWRSGDSPSMISVSDFELAINVIVLAYLLWCICLFGSEFWSILDVVVSRWFGSGFCMCA